MAMQPLSKRRWLSPWRGGDHVFDGEAASRPCAACDERVPGRQSNRLSRFPRLELRELLAEVPVSPPAMRSPAQAVARVASRAGFSGSTARIVVPSGDDDTYSPPPNCRS